MKNFEIIKGYYRQFNLKKEPRTEAPNGVSPDDQYNLAVGATDVLVVVERLGYLLTLMLLKLTDFLQSMFLMEVIQSKVELRKRSLMVTS